MIKAFSTAACIVLAGLGVAGWTADGAEHSVEAAPNAAGFKVDPVHSFVNFRCKHLGVSYAYGRFNDISGTFHVDPSTPEAATIDISVKSESVDTNNERRDNHLRSPDFFSAKEFPVISFKSKRSASGTDGKIAVTGDLSFHGVTKEVTVQVEHVGTGPGMRGGTISGFECMFTISRKEFGVSYMPEGLGDDVTILVACEGTGE